jgi:hypothetical protein
MRSRPDQGSSAPRRGATGAKTETAQSGAVKAALTFKESRDYVYSNLRLKITRSGQVLYDKPVPSCTGCSPEKVDPVSVRDIEATGEPDVILSLFSGGASCCQVDQVFSLDRRTSAYVESDRDFGS